MTETTAAPAPAEAKPTHGLTLADAAAQLKANRASAAAPTPELAQPEAAAEASNPEPGETAEAEGVDTEQSAPEETAEQPTEGETEPTDEQDDGQTVVQLKDGSQVPLEELVAGYMKEGDYRKKTQALAEERKSLAAERQTLDAERKAVTDKAKEYETGLQSRLAEAEAAAKEARELRERYATSIAEVEKALNAESAELAAIDWEIEAQRNPNWQIKFARYQKLQHAMEVTRAEKAEMEAKRKADADAADRQWRETAARAWQEQRQTLEQYIRTSHAELFDAEKAPQQFRAMADTAEAAGMPKEVLLAALGHQPHPDVPIMHPAVFELLRKATRYDQLVSEQTKVLASEQAPKPDATGRIKVVKGTAPRFRPPPAAAAELGRAQAAFNRDRSQANALKLMAAKRANEAAKRS